VLIPKGEFLMGNALEQMPQDKKIVLHCKSGVRSAEVHRVGGGVIGWVNQIEPEKPVY
jgi:rhodanese-related sulfurtransferase